MLALLHSPHSLTAPAIETSHALAPEDQRVPGRADWRRRYTGSQYMALCDGKHGCMARPLRCSVRQLSAEALARKGTDECTVCALSDVAYNPSAIQAPAKLVASAAKAGLHGVKYLGTSRINANNWRVNCTNPRTVLDWGNRRGLSSSDLLLLDARLTPLARVPIVGGNCARYQDAVVDARLVRLAPRGTY